MGINSGRFTLSHILYFSIALLIAFALTIGIIYKIALLIIMSALMIAFLLLLIHKRKWYLNRLKSTMENSSELNVLKKILGENEIKEFLPYMSDHLKHGNDFAKELVLDIIKDVEFEDKGSLFIETFRQGSSEIRFKIIDLIFDWKLTYDVLIEIMQTEELSQEEASYLLHSLFLNYRDICDNGFESEVKKNKKSFTSFSFVSDADKMMYNYLFNDKKEDYGKLIKHFLNSDLREDRLLAIEVMKNYVGVEDEQNRVSLFEAMENAKDNTDMLKETVEICAAYDTDFKYLKNLFSLHHDIHMIRKVGVCYDPTTIARAFKDEALPLSRAFIICASAKMQHDKMQQYYHYTTQMLDYIAKLSQEQSKINDLNSEAFTILHNEIFQIKNTFLIVVLDYLFSYYGLRRIKNFEQLLLRDESKEELLKIIQSAMPEAIVKQLELILNNNEEKDRSDYNYSLLRISEPNSFLEDLYKYAGGMVMDQKITENIEKMIVLKSIPMFKDLDVAMLHQVMKISSYRHIKANEAIVRAGEKGDSFFVIIEGSVSVLKNGNCLATLEKGNVIGELAVIDQQERTADVIANSNTMLLVIERDDFFELLNKNSSISISIIKTLTLRLRQMLSL